MIDQAAYGKKLGSGSIREDNDARVVETLEEITFRFTNEERRKKNLPLLRPSLALKFVARQHCTNMCRTATFQHESLVFPKGWKQFESRLRLVGLSSGGENIGYLTIGSSPQAWARRMVEGWMKSPSHRRNILDPRFRYMDVGVRACKNNIGYATQLFALDHGRTPWAGLLEPGRNDLKFEGR
jgi:uncharacterized protein YkwD